ncbi:hypothetical protein N2152v2_005733 [Parachlorella kessleri]
MQAKAAAAVVQAVLRLLPSEPTTQLGSSGSKAAFQLLSGCCRALLTTAADVVLVAHQGLAPLAGHTDEQAGLIPKEFLQGSTAVLSTTAALLSFVLTATREGGRVMDEAVYHICCFSLWILDGSRATPVPAIQRQLAGAAELILADRPVLDVLLPVLTAGNCRQARDFTEHATVCLIQALVGSSPLSWRVCGPGLAVWRATSRLLRQPKLAEALVRSSDTLEVAAAAVAASPTLLRRFLSGEPHEGLADVLDGISAAACHCGQLIMNRPSGPHAASSLSRVAWEGSALCFAALHAVLERGIPSWPTPAAALSERLSNAMRLVDGLLAVLGLRVITHGPTAVDPANADAAASAFDALARLCGRLWQNPDQLRAVVGSEPVHKLGGAAVAALELGPQAVARALLLQPDSQHRAFDSLGYLVASLSKLAMLLPLCTRGGFKPREVAKAVCQLHDCLAPYFTAGLFGKDCSARSCGRGCDHFILPVAYVVTTIVQAETAQSRSAELVACSRHLVKLALLLPTSKAVGNVNLSCVGWGAGGSGLVPLAAEAVQAVAVASWAQDAAWKALEDMVTNLGEVVCFRQPAVWLAESGVLWHLMAWTAVAAGNRSGRPGTKVFQLQRQILDVAVKVALGLLAECTEQSAPHPFTLRVLDKAWEAAELEDIIMTFHDSQEARSKGFWKGKVQKGLLPLAQSLTSCLSAQEEGQQLGLKEAQVLARRPCANPLCCNVSGCSEARLRGRRCSGCQVVRYCSRECQAADFAKHARVCGQLRQEHVSRTAFLTVQQPQDYRAGTRATCEVYGQECSLCVETTGAGNVQFKLLLEGGTEYTGSSPSAPFAKLALALRRLDIVNGMEAFGFHSCHVQALLRAAARAAGPLDQALILPQTDTPASNPPSSDATETDITATHMPARRLDHNYARSARDSGALLELQPALTDMLAALGHHRQRGHQRACYVNAPPSKGPTRQTYLDETHLASGNCAHPWQLRQDHALSQKTVAAGFATPATAKPEHWHPAGQHAQHAALDTPTLLAGTPSSREGCEITVMAMNDSQAHCMSAFGNGVWPSATKPTLPPLPAAAAARPSSRAGPADTDEALLQQLTSRPLSRARRRATATAAAGGKSSGRGWTAFTAFGLEMRDVVRAEAPWASATEVEKLVGQRWARLPPGEKQRYVDLAARVRKQMNGDGSGIGNGGGHRPACSDQPHHPASYAGAAACAPPGGGLKRSRSDAATAFLPHGSAGDHTAAGCGGSGGGLGALGLAALGLDEAPRPQRSLRPSRQYSTDLYATVDDLPWLQGGEEEQGGADDEADDYNTEHESLEDEAARHDGSGEDEWRSRPSQGRRRRQRPQQAQQQVHRGWPLPLGQHSTPSAGPAVGVEDETMEEDVLGLLTSMRAQEVEEEALDLFNLNSMMARLAMNPGSCPADAATAVQPAQYQLKPTAAPAKPSAEEGAGDSSTQRAQHDVTIAAPTVAATATGVTVPRGGRQEEPLQRGQVTSLGMVAGGGTGVQGGPAGTAFGRSSQDTEAATGLSES